MFDFDTPVDRHGTSSVKWDSHPETLPLWVADMDFKTAPVIIEAIERRAAHGIYGYSEPGNDYFEAIDKWFTRRHGWSIPRDHILYTTGVVPATSAVIKGLTKPGEGVLIMTPVYTCFFSSIRNNGCNIIESSLIDTGKRYEIDFADLEAKMAVESTRVLLLCNPHNPGGRVWTCQELTHIAELAARHNVIVLSDEIHCEIVMPGFEYTPFATVARGPWVAMISPSKAFNTAGLHVANIVAPDAEMREKINRAININETCDVGPFGIEALKAAYQGGEPWLEEMKAYVADNYELLKKTLADFKSIGVRDLEGTYLAWLDISALSDDVASFCDTLRRDALVWFSAGTAYGADGEGFIRVNLATSRRTLAEALSRFTDYISHHC